MCGRVRVVGEERIYFVVGKAFTNRVTVVEEIGAFFFNGT